MLKKTIDKLTTAVIPALGAYLVRLIGASMRMTVVNEEAWLKLRDDGKNVIFAFWHGRLLMMPYFYKGRGATILISRHRDGELVARAMRRFNIASVRGSTTRGWMGGVKGLLRAAKEGRDVVITPDGPKGPRYSAQTGAAMLARATGLPIIPVAFGASKKKPCKAGTPSSYPIRSPEGCLCSESLSL